MRFSVQPGASDDGPKRQQQSKFVRLDVIEKVEKPNKFQSKYLVQIGSSDFFQALKMIISGSMQHGNNRPKLSLEILKRTSYRVAIRQICREIAKFHADLSKAVK